MTTHVLGLGESLKEYKTDSNLTIGVNNIHSFVKTDYVVCIDQPHVFKEDRLNTILKTKCKGFYSHIDKWNHLDNFNLIKFNSGRGTLNGFDSDKFCYSNNSTYVAVVLAYKLGAKNIVLHGVDFRTHKNFRGNSFKRAIMDFRNLSIELNRRGVNLFVGSDWSALSEFLPLWIDKN